MELAKANQCTGCAACVQICPLQCIELINDQNGFRYPLADKAVCIECGKCQNVCPVLNKCEHSENTLAYAASSKNDKIRKSSSSGGIFSELATMILSCNGSVFGAAFDENYEVKHICVEDQKDLWKLRGAKYVQSEVGDCFIAVKQRLQSGQYVLFSGTPCQVAGLKSFLGRDYEKLLCIDTVCLGVPSPAVWKAYVKYRAETDNNTIPPCEINFRDKDPGWSHYCYSICFTYANGISYQVLNSDDIYMRLFSGSYTTRKSCGNCSFKGFSRVSDITLGDFWGIWDFAPEMDDNKGTSLLLVHTEIGRKAMDRISDNLKFKQMPLDIVSAQNHAILYSSSQHPKINKILPLAIAGRFDIVENLLNRYNKPSLSNVVKKKIQRCIKHIK